MKLLPIYRAIWRRGTYLDIVLLAVMTAVMLLEVAAFINVCWLQLAVGWVLVSLVCLLLVAIMFAQHLDQWVHRNGPVL
jgi:hypothetical protein